MFYFTNPCVFVPNIQLFQANPFLISPMNPVDKKKGSLSCYTMYPAVCKPIFSVKVAQVMTVKETAVWIWTLGYTYEWPAEAECYSRSFQENYIAGDMLPELSLHMQEDDQGIRNPIHRMEIANTQGNQCRAPVGGWLVQNRQGA